MSNGDRGPAEYILIPADLADHLARDLKQAADILANAGSLLLPNLAQAPGPTAAGPSPTGPKYKIGRSAGRVGYLDVVAAEFPNEVELELNSIWKILEPLVETEGRRPKDSLRVAFHRSDAWEHIHRPGKGSWWRRKDSAGDFSEFMDFGGEDDE